MRRKAELVFKWSSLVVGILAICATAYIYGWIAAGCVLAGETMFTIYGLISGMQEARENGGKADASGADVSVKP